MFRVYYADRYQVVLPATHLFPQGKHELVREQLVHRGVLQPQQLHEPELLDDATICLAHDAEYYDRLKNQQLSAAELKRIGLPYSPSLFRRALASASSSYWAAEAALDDGLGINLGGGTHHAYRDRAEAYCLLNDVAISATALLHSGRIGRALVIDLDVHQGNGTASMFADDARVFTFSMHCAHNYPAHKAQSDLDIALPAGTGDAVYLQHLHETLPALLTQHRPDVVYYLAGVDVLTGDRLGRLALTPTGVAARDHYVCKTVHQYGTPLVLLLAGGYPAHLPTVVDAHCESVYLALRTYER